MGAHMHVRRNDVVLVCIGRDAVGNKTGKVLQVLSGRGRVIVEGVNLVHKALRKSQERPQGGIIRKEAPIAAANVMLYCPHCKDGVRATRVRQENGRRVRTCKRCGHMFDG